eukprot:m.168645 g.168645  ORF g.168645 m.168645 type:complete len:137 (+) comp14755_c0_seq7:55-465(+)
MSTGAAAGGEDRESSRAAVIDMLEAAAAAHDAADSDSDSGANAADDRRWLQPRAGGARGIRVGEMYQAVLPTMAPPVGSGGPAAAAIAAAREPVRSVLEHVPDAERVEKKRKTGETPTPEAEGPEDSDDKKHRPER